MQVARQKLVQCPCCKSDFFIRYPDEFYAYPLTDDQKKFLEERKLKDDAEGVKTIFLT